MKNIFGYFLVVLDVLDELVERELVVDDLLTLFEGLEVVTLEGLEVDEVFTLLVLVEGLLELFTGAFVAVLPELIVL